MKVRVTITVEVDAETWEATHGVPRDQVREDVKMHIAGNVSGSDDAPIELVSWN